MLDQSELLARVLSELQEAGEENIPTLANTIFAAGQAAPERIPELQATLSQMIALGLIRIALEVEEGKNLEDLSDEDSQTFINQLENHLILRSHSNSWTGGLRPWPLIVTTNAGKERARTILDERGYRWWES